MDHQKAVRSLQWILHERIEAEESLEAAQETVLLVLGKLGPAASKAVPTIAKVLADPNPRLKPAVVQALGQIEPGARAARADLIPMLAHSNEPLRTAAAKALGNIDAHWASDPAIVSAFEDLAKQLNKADRSGEIVVDAFTVIGAVAVSVLITVLQSGNRVAQQNAAKVLGQIGEGAKIAVPALTKALEDSHPWVQDEAAKALEKIGDKAA